MQSVKLNAVLPCCVCEVFVNISCTDTLNTATFIEKQFHISVVYDHCQAISTVF